MLKRTCFFYNLFEMEQLQLKVERCASSEIKTNTFKKDKPTKDNYKYMYTWVIFI